MKLRFALIVAFASLALLLAACNFTMAADVTPPPNYVPPTPMATLGPLFPAQAPSTENGATIFAEKCAACHGGTGLGDGEQGIQLGVTVPAFGLPEVARPASLAQWYTMVTRGNMERFMPPFASLSDQERWDVVSYAMTLHMTEQEIARGKDLFETNCANCATDFFTDQETISELSAVEMARIVREGNDQVTPFGASLSDEDVWAVVAYLRTLAFDTGSVVSAPASTATLEPVTSAEVNPTAEAGTPSAEETPAGTEQIEVTAVAEAGFGTVSGSIENKTGEDLPSDLKVTVRGYDHGVDPSAGPQEVFTRDAELDEDGQFALENVEIPLNRIFLAEVSYEGLSMQSGFFIVKEDDTAVELPPITLYSKTEETSGLVVDETRIFFEYGADSIQVFQVYSFRNAGDQTVIVSLDDKGQIPFMTPPEGSSGVGYEPMQDTEPFQQTENGFAIPPSENPYGMIAFASVPKAKDFEFAQQFVLPIGMVTVFVPEGITVETEQSTDLGVQAIQDFNFQIYELGSIGEGETLKLAVSGTPTDASNASAPGGITSNQNLLIGAGALGVALILAGAWMYLRDRHPVEDETGEDDEDEFEASEDVIVAIIALDDLHRAKKISDEAYQKRRAELKDILREKM